MKKLFILFFITVLTSLNFISKAGSTDSDGYPIFYLKGSFNNTNWQPLAKYKFNRSGDTYSLTINSQNAIDNCEFKIGDDDWAYNFGAEATVNFSKYIDAVLNGPNMKTDGMSDAVISFTYNLQDPSSTEIKFVIDGVEPEPELVPDPNPGDGGDNDYPAVYVRGEFTSGSWMYTDPKYKFSCKNGVYTLNITSNNPIPAGQQFKIASEDWSTIDLGGKTKGISIDATQTIGLSKSGENLLSENGISSGSISFTYPGENYSSVDVKFVVDGSDPIERPVEGLSGTLPVLYINVYVDENHTAYNNEIISKDLSHKNYFDYAEYWLDMNGVDWMGKKAENVGSKEEPLKLQIKARGNWTRIGFSKKPFKLKLDKKQALCGLTKSKHFAILAHADDNKGYLRNFTGFNIGKRIGLPWTPSQQPIEVVINGNYRGLYFLTESIRIDEDRVNITELNDNVEDGELISGGYIVELDNYNEDDDAQIRMEEKVANGAWGHNVDMLRITFDTPEVYSPIMRRFITEQFTAMNNYVGQNNDLLWSYIDLDDAARYYIVEEIVSHTESYHGSTYLFRDRGEGHKWHFSPLWDFGNAFNGDTYDFFYNCDPFGNTWIPSMRMNKKFNDKVKETWLWFMSNEFEGLIDDIDEYIGHLSEAAKADHERWKNEAVPSGGQPVANNTDLKNRRNEVVDHLTSKINWLKSQFGDYTQGTYSEPERDTTLAAQLPDYALSGISTVTEKDIESEDELYNLQGIRVTNPTPGSIYIFRQGNNSQKVIIR